MNGLLGQLTAFGNGLMTGFAEPEAELAYAFAGENLLESEDPATLQAGPAHDLYMLSSQEDPEARAVGSRFSRATLAHGAKTAALSLLRPLKPKPSTIRALRYTGGKLALPILTAGIFFSAHGITRPLGRFLIGSTGLVFDDLSQPDSQGTTWTDWV